MIVLRVALVVHDVQTHLASTAAVLVLLTNVSKFQTKTSVVTHAVSVFTVELRVKTAGAIASTSTVTVRATRTMNGHSGVLTVVSRLIAVSVDSAMKAAVSVWMDIVEPVALCHQVME